MDESAKTVLEDGEITDSEDNATDMPSSKPAVAPSVSSSSYRVQRNNDSDSSSDDGDDSDVGLPCKKPRPSACQSETRTPEPVSHSAGRGRKQNNIWCSVLQDDMLTQTMTSALVEEKDCVVDRDVESYSYSLSSTSNTRPISDDEPEAPNVDADICDKESFSTSDSVKKTSDVKSRLGRKRTVSDRKSVKERLHTYDATVSRDHIGATADDSAEDVIEAIMRTLGEPDEKADVFKRVVTTAGVKKALQLLYMTEDVQSAGGMMIADQSRRRTSGGVFFTLLKSDPDLTKAQMNEIFSEENKIWKEKCKQKKRFHRRQQVRNGKKLDAPVVVKETQTAAVKETPTAVCEMPPAVSGVGADSDEDFMLDDSCIEIEFGVG